MSSTKPRQRHSAPSDRAGEPFLLTALCGEGLEVADLSVASSCPGYAPLRVWSRVTGSQPIRDAGARVALAFHIDDEAGISLVSRAITWPGVEATAPHRHSCRDFDRAAAAGG